MKERFLFLLLFISSLSFSQSVNDFKGVVVPLKFEFQKTENSYRINTMTKFSLIKAGFEAFYTNELISANYNDKCKLLQVDVVSESSFMATKLYLVFKDCNGKVIFQSAVGKSREKEYQAAYTEALNLAFVSVYALHYKYNGKMDVNGFQQQSESTVVAPLVSTIVINEDSNSIGVLFAQPMVNGFQLVDSSPKVIMKIFKTSNASCYIAEKGTIKGVLVSELNQWFFEYYQDNKLISEKVLVKF
jgi:hypothetical protein